MRRKKNFEGDVIAQLGRGLKGGRSLTRETVSNSSRNAGLRGRSGEINDILRVQGFGWLPKGRVAAGSRMQILIVADKC